MEPNWIQKTRRVQNAGRTLNTAFCLAFSLWPSFRFASGGCGSVRVIWPHYGSRKATKLVCPLPPQKLRIALAHLVRELREAHGGADAVMVWPEVADEPFQAVGFISPVGKLLGTAPTNKRMTLKGITINRVVGGKIVEDWTYADQLGMMQQLGMAPLPSGGGS